MIAVSDGLNCLLIKKFQCEFSVMFEAIKHFINCFRKSLGKKMVLLVLQVGRPQTTKFYAIFDHPPSSLHVVLLGPLPPKTVTSFKTTPWSKLQKKITCVIVHFKSIPFIHMTINEMELLAFVAIIWALINCLIFRTQVYLTPRKNCIFFLKCSFFKIRMMDGFVLAEA